MKRREEGKTIEDDLLLIHIELLCKDKEEIEVFKIKKKHFFWLFSHFFGLFQLFF